MDDLVSPAALRPRPRISAAEMERRRAALRAADASNRLEGIERDAASDAIFDACIRGEIAVKDVVRLLKAQAGLG